MKTTATILSLFIGMLCPCLISAQGAGNADKQIQEKTETLLDRIKQHVNIGGYAHIGYVYNDFDPASGKSTNSFEITRVMLTADIKITDRLNAFCMYDLAKGTLHEIWAEYAFAPAFKLKAGQFKTPYTIESNMALSVVEQIRGAQAVQYMAGINGSDPSYGPFAGRDIGIMASGSLLNVGSHDLFAYSIGVFNGQGINQKDGNKRKDVAGMVSVYPLKDWRLAGSFQIGQGHAYADNPYGLFKKGDDYKRNRWSVGTEYFHKYLTLRSEYLRGKDSSADSQGGYVMASIHLHPKLDLMLSYDVLNKNLKTCDKQTDYIAGLQWNIYRKCRFEIQYMHSRRDKGIGNSNLLLTQLQVGF